MLELLRNVTRDHRKQIGSIGIRKPYTRHHDMHENKIMLVPFSEYRRQPNILPTSIDCIELSNFIFFHFHGYH